MASEEGSELQSWIDKCALSELVSVLAAAVDRADQARITDSYTEHSFDDHGVFKGSGAAFANFICDSDFFTSMHHQIGQSVFDVRGDQAWGETYFSFHGQVAAVVVSGYGRYVDYFEKADGTWKLAYRRVVPDKVPEGDDLSAYWLGSRDTADPSYDRLTSPDEADGKRPQ